MTSCKSVHVPAAKPCFHARVRCMKALKILDDSRVKQRQKKMMSSGKKVSYASAEAVVSLPAWQRHPGDHSIVFRNRASASCRRPAQFAAPHKCASNHHHTFGLVPAEASLESNVWHCSANNVLRTYRQVLWLLVRVPLQLSRSREQLKEKAKPSTAAQPPPGRSYRNPVACGAHRP